MMDLRKIDKGQMVMRMCQTNMVAFINEEYDVLDQQGLTRDKLPELMETVRAELNKLVAPYERLSSIEVMENEFEKTPKRSIKRFLYR